MPEIIEHVGQRGELEETSDMREELIAYCQEMEDKGTLVKAPYLLDPPQKSFTLVLDLDETLLHFEELTVDESQLSIRPGADSFLTLMAQYFEVVIFTAGTADYADWALGFLESSAKAISHRLYRRHTIPMKGNYLKDLSRLGRSLRKTIIVDNLAENFSLHPENGIAIKTWQSDAKDTALFQLAPLLLKICESGGVDDVRQYLQT